MELPSGRQKIDLLITDFTALNIDTNNFHAKVIMNRVRGTSFIKVHCVTSTSRWAMTNALFNEKPSCGYTVAPIIPRVLGPYVRDHEDLTKQIIKD